MLTTPNVPEQMTALERIWHAEGTIKQVVDTIKQELESGVWAPSGSFKGQRDELARQLGERSNERIKTRTVPDMAD